MPSGFQQSTEQLKPSFFRVVLDLSGYPTADGNDNGGVTPNSADSFTTVNLPTTLAKGQARARGNMRFRNIVNRLTRLTDAQILDIEIEEANGDAQATALALTVKYERVEFIPSTGTDIAGGNITTVAGYIKDQVARGIQDATTASARVYDGTSAEDKQLPITVATPVAVAANLLADVTVTLIDGTEVITVDNVGGPE